MRLERPRVLVPEMIWRTTWSELNRRSGGANETACVWGGERVRGLWSIRSVHFLDDFGPVNAGPLHHRASREGVEHLFDELRRRGEVVVADVHTHPADWVDLSPTDEAHPIEFRVGLLAVVVPWFASRTPTLEHVGVHEYMATSTWRRLSPSEVSSRIRVEP